MKNPIEIKSASLYSNKWKLSLYNDFIECLSQILDEYAHHLVDIKNDFKSLDVELTSMFEVKVSKIEQVNK